MTEEVTPVEDVSPQGDREAPGGSSGLKVARPRHRQ